ncbi:hypothetical protein F66182_3172 [Fusarium sp. NRRL 66182]|nr:hypothetical protein F66182_3172 [Fusarium sp. NRRL 66182]
MLNPKIDSIDKTFNLIPLRIPAPHGKGKVGWNIPHKAKIQGATQLSLRHGLAETKLFPSGEEQKGNIKQGIHPMGSVIRSFDSAVSPTALASLGRVSSDVNSPSSVLLAPGRPNNTVRGMGR